MVQCSAGSCFTSLTVIFFDNEVKETQAWEILLMHILVSFLEPGPFLCNVFQDAHGPYHLSVKPVGPYQKVSQ